MGKSNMTNAIGPQPGNEKKAAARRRTRANKRGQVGPLELLGDLSMLPPSRMKNVSILLWIVGYGSAALVVFWMFLVALESL